MPAAAPAAAIADPAAAPACRVCGAARAPGMDQCAACGASEAECRRWRRRADARWRMLRRQLLLALVMFVIALPLGLVAIGKTVEFIFSSLPSQQPLSVPIWATPLMYLISMLVLATAIASSVLLDRAVRKLPTWNLAPWPIVGRIPASGLLMLAFFLGGGFTWSPWMVLSHACWAISVLATFRLTLVIRQMDRWVRVDRRVASDMASAGPVRLAWYRDRPWLRPLLVLVPFAAVALFARFGTVIDADSLASLCLWAGPMITWSDAVLAARGALRRWLDG